MRLWRSVNENTQKEGARDAEGEWESETGYIREACRRIEHDTTQVRLMGLRGI